MFLPALVSLLAGLRETTRPIITKFGGKVARGLQTKPLDISGNPDHVTLG